MRPALLLVLVGCGRLGFDPFGDDGNDPGDGCPADTVAISAGAPVCVERMERGTVPWTDAVDDCATSGRRLCTDAEWFEACVSAPGAVDLIDGGYEWVAEESGGIAQKRGSTDCTVMSTHVVTDPYEYRCCLDL